MAVSKKKLQLRQAKDNIIKVDNSPFSGREAPVNMSRKKEIDEPMYLLGGEYNYPEEVRPTNLGNSPALATTNDVDLARQIRSGVLSQSAEASIKDSIYNTPDSLVGYELARKEKVKMAGLLSSGAPQRLTPRIEMTDENYAREMGRLAGNPLPPSPANSGLPVYNLPPDTSGVVGGFRQENPEFGPGGPYWNSMSDEAKAEWFRTNKVVPNRTPVPNVHTGPNGATVPPGPNKATVPNVSGNGLLNQATKPLSIAEEAIAAGDAKGDANRSKEEQLSFMDKIFNNPMLQRMMERSLYSQPTFGGNFISEQASGERGLRSMEAQSAERQNKLNIAANKLQATTTEKKLDRESVLEAARIKAGNVSKGRIGSVEKIATNYNKARQTQQLLSQLKNLTPDGAIGGIIGKGASFFTNIAAAFNLNPESTTSEKINDIRATLLNLSRSETGKQLKSDADLLATAFDVTGKLTTTPNKFIAAIKRLYEVQSNKVQVQSQILKEYGVDPRPYDSLRVVRKTKS
jgi:hypothetical protein